MRSMLRPRPAPVIMRLRPPEWEPLWSDLLRTRQGLDEAMVGLVALQDQLDWPDRGVIEEAVYRLTVLQRLMARFYVLLAMIPSNPGAVADPLATAPHDPAEAAPAASGKVVAGV